MLLSLGTANDQMSLIGARPQHDTFGIQNAMLVSPGAPDQSVPQPLEPARSRPDAATRQRRGR